MPTLKLVFKNKTLENYPLKKGYSLTIGRKRNNDIIIENLAVSSHHAKIDSVGDGFVLIDLQSKNGSFVNAKLVDSHWLKPGDIVSIGKHSLEFTYSENEEPSGGATEEIEKTMIMDTNDYRSMVNQSKDEAPEPPAEAKKPNTIAILRVETGGSGKYKCRNSTLKIGKYRDSDIVVKGFGVGGTSATISKRADGFYLSYIGGISRPKVNSKKVKSDKLLHDNDIIKIGKTTLRFSERRPGKSKEKKSKKNQNIPQVSPE
jgi:pSer/pThr/pTyr-binding forkhead associated (FHA) protein